MTWHPCDVSVRAHLHQRGAGPPAGAGSVFRVGRVFTLARVRTQFHFTGAPFRGIGSLIYKYRPISAPYSCGSRRRIALWAISAGARRGGRAGPQRCKQHHTIPSNRSTAEPAGGIRSGAPRKLIRSLYIAPQPQHKLPCRVRVLILRMLTHCVMSSFKQSMITVRRLIQQYAKTSIRCWPPGPWFNMKMSSYQCWKSCCGEIQS